MVPLFEYMLARIEIFHFDLDNAQVIHNVIKFSYSNLWSPGRKLGPPTMIPPVICHSTDSTPSKSTLTTICSGQFKVAT